MRLKALLPVKAFASSCWNFCFMSETVALLSSLSKTIDQGPRPDALVVIGRCEIEIAVAFEGEDELSVLVVANLVGQRRFIGGPAVSRQRENRGGRVAIRQFQNRVFGRLDENSYRIEAVRVVEQCEI